MANPRFDRSPPERDPTRINERIRGSEVRLIDEKGQQVGIVPTDEALKLAQERDLDLVEVAADARPPVTRLLDYSKYRYEQEQKAKAARKHQQQVNVREIKLRPKIADHDYNTKKGHVERFAGILIEHHAGRFPVWLAPVQAAILPVADRHNAYANEVAAQLRGAGVRCAVDDRTESVGKKIRDAELHKRPFMLIVGDREAQDETVSVRSHSEGDLGALTLDNFARRINELSNGR